VAMFKAGEIDVLDLPMPAYRAEILDGGPNSIQAKIDKGEVTLKKWKMFTYYYVGWNFRHFALREKKVRQALAHLYPQERIGRDILYGLGEPHDSPIHPWERAYAKDLPQYSFSVKEANALLDAAGWKMNSRGVREKAVDGELKELRIKVLYPVESATARDRFLLFQKAALPAGVLLEPNQREWQTMTKMMDDKDLDAALVGWGMAWDSDPSQIWHSDSAKTAKGSNFISYMSPELDKAIGELEVAFDPQKRIELWHRFQHIIAEDQPYRFTFILTRPWVVNNRLGNQYFAKLRPQDWFLPWYVKDGK
jgi:peptide/nickel transport system substrate-binding protein